MSFSIPLRVRQHLPLVMVIASAIAAVTAYMQSLNYPFFSDDVLYVVGNQKLADLRLTELWRLLLEPYNPSFEFLPLRDLSFWIDIKLFGENPAALRLHNILLYLLCLPLVYATTAGLWRYFRPADAAGVPWAAAIVTTLFALHPALVESVVWVSGRKYILPDFFSLLALWLALKVKRDQGFSTLFALATLVAFVGVMFSKSSYVGVAPIIALLWLVFWFDIPTLRRRRMLLLWPLTILFLAIFLLLIFIKKNQGVDTVPAYVGLESVTRSFAILGGLARISVSPEARHFYHPLFDDPWFSLMLGLGVAIFCATGWSLVTLKHKRSLASLSIIVFFLLCVPYLQLIPGKPPSLVADRYVVLAIWPAIMLIVLLAWRLKPLPRTALLLLIALSWLYQTVERPRDWQSEKSFFDADFGAYPEYYLPAFYLTNYQLHRGMYSEAANEANHVSSPEFRNVLAKLVTADRVSHVDAVSSGNPREAMLLLLELEQLIDRRPAQAQWDTPMIFAWTNLYITLSGIWIALSENFPDNVTVRYNTGQYLFNLKYYLDAAVHLRVVAESKETPAYARGTVFKTLGLALLGSGQLVKSEAALRAALTQSPPDLQAYCGLADVLNREGQLNEAAQARSKCLSNGQR